jgi:nucleoside-diphosphate-sugar epimerase
VHVLDIAKAVKCVLEAPAEIVRSRRFNVGSNEQNLQIRSIAELVGEMVGNCTVEFGPPSADRRNYRADFGEIGRQLPGFTCEWSLERGIREMLSIFERSGFGPDDFLWRGYWRIAQVKHLLETGQIDESLRWRSD